LEYNASKKQSVKSLEKQTDISRRHILRLLKTDQNPSLYTICHIAKALKVEPYELLHFNLNQKVERSDMRPIVFRATKCPSLKSVKTNQKS
jgi:transcriptional regulator with XRE-family HTH domain